MEIVLYQICLMKLHWSIIIIWEFSKISGYLQKLFRQIHKHFCGLWTRLGYQF